MTFINNKRICTALEAIAYNSSLLIATQYATAEKTFYYKNVEKQKCYS